MSDDPRSWLDMTGDEPSPLLRNLLDSAKADDPQAADVARLTAKLAAALPPGTLTPDGGGGGGGGMSGAGSAGAGGAAGWAIGGGVLIGLAVLGGVVATSPSGAPLAPHTTTAVVSDLRTALPDVAPVVSVATSGSALAPPLLPTASVAAPPTEAESAMLARAYEELRHGSPQRAMAIAGEHARAYPHGSFAQEREMIAIEALTKLGDRAGAQARAAAFRKTYPRSSHLPRLATISPEP